jgi:hypothetical protein
MLATQGGAANRGGATERRHPSDTRDACENFAMSNPTRVAVVLVGAVVLAASASSGSNAPTCPPNGPCGGNYSTPPALIRTEKVTTEKAFDGIEIQASPVGATAWKLSVTNTTESMVTIVWDESSFVTSDGQAGGRLIHGTTRKLDTAKAQAGTPIPPSATINELFLVEKFIEAEEFESRFAQTPMDKSQIARMEALRKDRKMLIIGAKLYVTIQGATKQTWIGSIEEAK